MGKVALLLAGLMAGALGALGDSACDSQLMQMKVEGDLSIAEAQMASGAAGQRPLEELLDGAVRTLPSPDADRQWFGNYIEFSPDGALLAASAGGGVLYIFRADTLALVHQFELSGYFSWSPDSSRLALGSAGEDSVTVIDASSGGVLWKVTGPHRLGSMVAFSPDGTLVAAGAPGSDLFLILDAASGQELKRLESPTGAVAGRSANFGGSGAWSPDGTLLAIGAHKDRAFYIFNASSGEQLRAIAYPGSQGFGGQLAWSPDSARVATSAALDDEVYMFDVSSGEQLWKAQTAQIKCWGNDLKWAPADRLFIRCGSSGAVLVLNATSGDQLFELPIQKKGVWYSLRVSLTPSGSLLAYNDPGQWGGEDHGLGGAVYIYRLHARSSATMVGDPHMLNVRGEKFEVRMPGAHEVLNVPRGAGADESLLLVDALVEPEEAAQCAALFVRRIDIRGRWLGATPPITLSAGDGVAGHVGGPGLKVGNRSSLTIEDFASLVPSAMLRVSLPSKTPRAPALPSQHATGMTASLRLGPGVALKVSWVLERTPSMSLSKSLWVTVSGLSKVREPIGGLLGIDDHHRASMPEPACDDQGARLLAFRPGKVLASASMDE